MEKGFVLREVNDFSRAMELKTNVIVWQNGKIINYGGPIQLQTENAVIIVDTKYLKTEYEFRVR